MPKRSTEAIARKLKTFYGFGTFYANSYAWSISQGPLKESSIQIKAIKWGRRKHVMEYYEDLGGKFKSPNFTKSGKAREAVKRADDDLRRWGWEGDNTTAYFAIYYYGVKKKEDWDGIHKLMKQLAKQLRRGEGAIIHVSKH